MGTQSHALGAKNQMKYTVISSIEKMSAKRVSKSKRKNNAFFPQQESV